LEKTTASVASCEERIGVLEKVAASFQDWQPGIEGSVDDIRLEVRKINKHMEKVAIEQAPSKSGGIFSFPESASVRPPAGVHADGPDVHRKDNNHREDGYGSVTALTYPRSRVRFLIQLISLPSLACINLASTLRLILLKALELLLVNFLS
jgi:hypothetical protein